MLFNVSCVFFLTECKCDWASWSDLKNHWSCTRCVEVMLHKKKHNTINRYFKLHNNCLVYIHKILYICIEIYLCGKRTLDCNLFLFIFYLNYITLIALPIIVGILKCVNGKFDTWVSSVYTSIDLPIRYFTNEWWWLTSLIEIINKMRICFNVKSLFRHTHVYNNRKCLKIIYCFLFWSIFWCGFFIFRAI